MRFSLTNKMTAKPNIILILADDMGYSDIGCYGGEIDTPNLDSMAEKGLRFTNFYNTARCSPSRASLLTGLHPHQTDVGLLVSDHSPEGYSGNLNKNCVTIAEVLKENGYATYMSGKWHVTNDTEHKNESWPKERGFEKVYSMLCGATNYYYPKCMVRGNKFVEKEAKYDEDFYLTDAITDNAIHFINSHFNQENLFEVEELQENNDMESKRKENDTSGEKPFFLYVTYNAPHWPLQAKPEDLEKYKGRYDDGWDVLRKERFERMKKLGIFPESAQLSDRDPKVPPWESVKHKKWQARRMETYAAMVDSMDQGIGRILDALETHHIEDETIVVFLSDNGGCAEDLNPLWNILGLQGSGYRDKTKKGEKIKFGNRKSIMPGPENTFQSVGQAWANLSNTPFRLYKHWIHEGGIATPFIVRWPEGIDDSGGIRTQIGQLPDIMATILDVTAANYPKKYDGHEIHPPEGTSLQPVFEAKNNGKEWLFFEHEGNSCIRNEKWKLVRDFPLDWELFNIQKDPTELQDLSQKKPDLVQDMIERYEKWADQVGVINFYDVLCYEIRDVVSFLPKFLQKIIARFLARWQFSHKQWHKKITKNI